MTFPNGFLIRMRIIATNAMLSLKSLLRDIIIVGLVVITIVKNVLVNRTFMNMDLKELLKYVSSVY